MTAVSAAEKVAADATSVTQEDVDRLRGLGLSDGEIFDVVLAAALRAFFTKALDAAGVEPDAGYRELEPELREALVVGRPIAAG
jgi:alkylhydroperoxidase family enzyme